MTIVTDIIEILLAGLTEMAGGIGSGLNELVTNVFLVKAAEGGAITGLSVFGQVCIAFAGVALAIGLSRFIVNWVTSFGK